MDEEKLKEMYEMVQENHRMLQTMRRNALLGNIFKVVFWIFILIVIPYFTYLYFQPYIQQISNMYSSLHGANPPASSGTTMNFFSQIQKFFQQFTGTSTSSK